MSDISFDGRVAVVTGAGGGLGRTYALELAQLFSAFYRDCKIVGAEGAGVEPWRAALTAATRDGLATCLDLLGVHAPERMERRDEDDPA